MQNKIIDQVFRRSAEKGWGAVRFNFRGVGQSTGKFDNGAGETEDILNVFQWTCREFDRKPEEVALLGYSFGSWVSAKAAAAMPALEKLILVAPPVTIMDFSPLNQASHTKHVFAAERDEISAIEETEKWYSVLPPPKSLHVIRGADHFFVGETGELIRGILRTLDR